MNFICPICKNELIKENKSLSCINKHSFDIAKSGYCNLNIQNNSSKSHGDNKEMVNSRTSFLNKDYYLPLKKELISIVKKINPTSLVDCGCGEGYYTRGFSQEMDECQVVGVDLSKEAINYASKNDKKCSYIISSLFKIPLVDECSDVLVSIFAPLALDEFYRLLKKDGKLIVVSPKEKHLYGLKKQIYAQAYFNEVEYIKDDRFELIDEKVVDANIILENQEDIQNLFSMTPYYYKTKKEDKDKLSTLLTLETKISFSIQIYKKQSS